MSKYGSIVIVMAVAAMCAGSACRSRESAEQKKVQELQAQLDDAKKQLAAQDQARSQPAAPAPQPSGGQTAAPAQPPAPAGAAPAPAKRTAAPGTPAGATGAAGATGVSKDQYTQDGAKVKDAFTQQQSVNEQQAQTNAEVQQQIEELKPREYTLPAGTVIAVRTTTELSSSRLANGSTFEALLERQLAVGGALLAREGAHVTGIVVSSDPGGRVKGVASLEVTIRAIAGVGDHTIRVATTTYSTEAGSTKGRDAKRTGILAGAGAAIGAIAGGGKGAAIGAGAGAAAGVGTNMATRGKAAVIPAETLIEFTLRTPTTVIIRP